MCERDGCEMLMGTTIAEQAQECKCHIRKHPSSDLQQKQKFHLHLQELFENANMHQPQPQSPRREDPLNVLIDPAQQQGSHMDGYFSPNGSTGSPNSSISSNFTSDSRSSFCSISNSAPPSPTNPHIGVNLRVTGQCSQGGRKYMEDFFSVAYQQTDNATDLEYAFIGIYDGHGGSEAAKYAKECLMMEIITQKLFWSNSDQDIMKAIREGYIATHYAMWREQAKWPKTANGLPSTAGTTATVAFIRREKIYIGHVGDSGIVLGYQHENENFWRAKQLTTDHKPESHKERERINRAGGKVVVKSQVPRVVWNRPRNANHRGPVRRNTPVDEIPFLAVARSLGDLWSYNLQVNEFVVSPDPDVKVVKINPKTFRCLIFGTDGLWNVVTPQEAVDVVFEKETLSQRLGNQTEHMEGTNWTNPSKGLVEKALKTWSSKKMRADNTSVVTVIMYPPGCCHWEKSNSTSVGKRELRSSAVPVTPVLSTPMASTMPSGAPTYSLEINQMNADFLTYSDETSYQQIVEKYMPPEEFRNFTFSDDECEVRSVTAERELRKLRYNNVASNNVCDKTDELRNNTNAWGWDKHHHQQKTVICESCREEVHEREPFLVMDSPTKAPSGMANYCRFINETSGGSLEDRSIGHNSYMDSFAETYIQEASTSNSNPAYQSITGRSMHEILQEQQRYQQQCMSEEEGYSLTKLETRREQQRLNGASSSAGVQTFKIFQQQQSAENYMNGVDLAQSQPSQQQHYWPSTYEQPKVQAPPPPKPLELDALLQQERLEEQQVALERMAMHQANNSASNILQVLAQQATEEDDDAESYVEFLEDECAVKYATPCTDLDDTSDEDEAEIEAIDESVQINEISSSIFETTITTTSVETPIGMQAEEDDEEVMSAPAIIENIESIEILPAHYRAGLAISSTSSHASSSKPSELSISLKRTQLQTHIQSHYPNIPNENETESKRRRLQEPSPCTAKMTSNNLANERRQLRSSGHVVDFVKHTLRTRNTLGKPKGVPPSASSSPLSLKRSRPLICTANERNHQATSSACVDSNSTSPAAYQPYAINLRSRLIVTSHTTPKKLTSDSITCHNNATARGSPPPRSPTTSSPVRGDRERRNTRNPIEQRTRSLRNTKELTVAAAVTNFCKSTRSQSAARALNIARPSPKQLLNTVAAMTALTRTRTSAPASARSNSHSRPASARSNSHIRLVDTPGRISLRSSLANGGSTLRKSVATSAIPGPAQSNDVKRNRISKRR